jgi:hypothetical protein
MDDVDHTQDPAPYTINDPITVITSGGKPVYQRFILYYIGFMDQADHDALYGHICPAISGGATAPELTCPHKWIIKKEIYLNEQRNNGPPNTLDATADAKLFRFLTDHESQSQLMNEAENGSAPILGSAGFPLIHSVRIVAQNVLSFELARLALDTTNPLSRPTPSASGPIILFDIKMFKTDAQRHVAITGNLATASMTGQTVNVVADPSDANQTVSAFTVQPQYAPYTVQVDNRVIPSNP